MLTCHTLLMAAEIRGMSLAARSRPSLSESDLYLSSRLTASVTLLPLTLADTAERILPPVIRPPHRLRSAASEARSATSERICARSLPAPRSTDSRWRSVAKDDANASDDC